MGCFSTLASLPVESLISAKNNRTGEILVSLAAVAWNPERRLWRTIKLDNRPDCFDPRCHFKKWSYDRDDYIRTLHKWSLMPAAIGATVIAWITVFIRAIGRRPGRSWTILWELLWQRATMEAIQTVPWASISPRTQHGLTTNMSAIAVEFNQALFMEEV